MFVSVLNTHCQYLTVSYIPSIFSLCVMWYHLIDYLTNDLEDDKNSKMLII